MTLLQILSAVLFFYVFGLAAVIMTYFTVITVMRFVRGRNGKQEAKPPEKENKS